MAAFAKQMLPHFLEGICATGASYKDSTCGAKADPKKGGDLGKLGQGLHALQDAVAHKGASTNDHLGFNFSSFGKFANDIYGYRAEAANLTRSALIVVDVLQGKKANLKDGDNLDLRGMSGKQTLQFLQGLVKLGFSGRIYNK